MLDSLVPKGTPTLTGFTFRGKEIALAKKSGRKVGGLTAKAEQKGIYSQAKKQHAVALYAATGDLSKSAELAEIPKSTLQKWRTEPWFQALMHEVWEENNERIDAKFSEIIEKSLDQVVDRLENGDVKVLKDGKTVRVPISARDLSLVSAINVDKRQLLRGLPTSRSESLGASSVTVSRLEKLAETFENLAKFGRKKVEIIDVEEVHALPKPTTEALDVHQQAGNGQALGERNSQGEEIARTSQTEEVIESSEERNTSTTQGTVFNPTPQ